MHSANFQTKMPLFIHGLVVENKTKRDQVLYIRKIYINTHGFSVYFSTLERIDMVKFCSQQTRHRYLKRIYIYILYIFRLLNITFFFVISMNGRNESNLLGSSCMIVNIIKGESKYYYKTV